MLSYRVFVFATFVVLARCDLELKLLHVLFRHGDKVPHQEYQNYPNDPWRNYSFFPIDNGGLTNQGKLREYKIGTVLRERYNRFFGDDYLPSMIYARSTDLPRTQMSLQLVLAGLFPPSKAQTWNPHLPWAPVSMFSVPVEQDYLLFPHHCPRYREEYQRFLRDDSVKEIINKYKKTMDYLTWYTGKKIDTTSAVYYLYNLLKEEAAQNLTLPEWSHYVYPSPMREITALDFNMRSYTKTLRRLNGGMVLRKITEDILDLQDEVFELSQRKAFFFSSHEVNVAALARTLGTDDPVIPLYGSTIILETLRDKMDQYYVRIVLWTGVTEKLIIQRLPGCTEVCPLEEFLDITSDVIPNDEEYDCMPFGKQNERRQYANYAGRRARSRTASSSRAVGIARSISEFWHLTLSITLIIAFSRIDL